MIGLAIPMLNEEQNVQPVLEEICTVLTTAHIPFKIAAVNNGSTDGTHPKIMALAQQNPNIIPIHLPQNQKYGGGILAGMRALESENLDVIGWMWGDGQISPSILPTLYHQCQAGSAFPCAGSVQIFSVPFQRFTSPFSTDFVINSTSSSSIFGSQITKS